MQETPIIPKGNELFLMVSLHECWLLSCSMCISNIRERAKTITKTTTVPCNTAKTVSL